MKVTGKKAEEIFKTIELKIALESEEEAGAFFAMFNAASLVDMEELDSIDDNAIREAIKQQLGRSPKYLKAHEAICRKLKP